MIIITALLTFLATNVDDLVIFFVLFSKYRHQKQAISVALGYLTGFTSLIATSLLASYGLSFIDEKWIGWLGFIPLFLGGKALFGRKATEETSEANEASEKTEKYQILFIGVLIIKMIAGFDNLGVYIPLFSTITREETWLVVVIYLICAVALILSTYGLSKIKVLLDVFEKIEHVVVPIVLILLGFMILTENGVLILPF